MFTIEVMWLTSGNTNASIKSISTRLTHNLHWRSDWHMEKIILSEHIYWNCWFLLIFSWVPLAFRYRVLLFGRWKWTLKKMKIFYEIHIQFDNLSFLNFLSEVLSKLERAIFNAKCLFLWRLFKAVRMINPLMVPNTQLRTRATKL